MHDTIINVFERSKDNKENDQIVRRKLLLGILSVCSMVFIRSASMDSVVSANTDNEDVCVVSASSSIRAQAEKDIMLLGQTISEKIRFLHFIDAWDEWHDVVIDPTVLSHSYNWNCLKRDGAQISYEGDSSYFIRRGLDVSYHQGAIDWRKVKDDGYDFAFIRIGYRGYGTEGTINEDKKFKTNLIDAQAAGLDVGVYFFSQAVNEEEALEEAEFVIEQLSGMDLQLPIVYDPELIRDHDARTDDVTGEQFTMNAIAFCEAVSQAGFEPMIYSNMVWEGFLFDMKQLENYPFWYADYEPIPQTPYHFIFWQYTDKGQVNGISGAVDLDIQFINNEK